jgi:hypothetical protein
MLKQIDSFYLTKAFEMIQLMAAAYEVVDNIEAGQTPGNGSLEILTLCLTDAENGDLAFEADIRLLSEKEVILRCSEMTDRLKSRCAGLIEVQEVRHVRDSPRATPKARAKVQYSHCS